MSKFKKGLVGEVKAEKQFEKEQEDLKQKYSLDVSENVVVVEKSNIYKFTVKILIDIIKGIATIILLTLATIGILTIIYPESRDGFVNVMNDIYYQLSQYLTFM